MLYPDIHTTRIGTSVCKPAGKLRQSKLPDIFHRLDDRVHFKGDYDLSHARSSVSKCENLCKPASDWIFILDLLWAQSSA